MTKICIENFIEVVALRAGQDCDQALACLMSKEIEWRKSGQPRTAADWILICMMAIKGNPVMAQEALESAGLRIEERSIVFQGEYTTSPYRAKGFCLMVDITHQWVNKVFSDMPYGPSSLLKLPGADGRGCHWISIPLAVCLHCLGADNYPALRNGT